MPEDDSYEPSSRSIGTFSRGTSPTSRMSSDVNRGLACPEQWARKESLEEMARRRARGDASIEDGIPSGPGGGRAKPRGVAVRLCIFDVDSVVYGVEKEAAELMTKQLQSLGDQGPPALRDVLNSQGIRFSVVFAEGEPTKATKAAFLPLDYPIYVIADDPSRRASEIERIHRIMDEQAIPVRIAGSPVIVRDEATDSWNKASVRGMSVPPGFGARAHVKCAFLKGRTMRRESQDPRFFGNIVLHEFGHMNNIFRTGAHPSDRSMMSVRMPLRDLEAGLRRYNEVHAKQIILQLSKLWALQRAM